MRVREQDQDEIVRALRHRQVKSISIKTRLYTDFVEAIRRRCGLLSVDHARQALARRVYCASSSETAGTPNLDSVDDRVCVVRRRSCTQLFARTCNVRPSRT